MSTVSRQTRKRQKTRDQVAETAFGLFETHGYDAVTMEQIAHVADVARGTLYNHFSVKEAVLAHAIHARLQRDLAPLMAKVMRKRRFDSRVATLMEASAGWWRAHRHYLAPYLRYRFQGVGTQREANRGAAASDMVDAYRALIEAAQSGGELRHDVAAERLAVYLHFLYLSALMRWLDDPGLSLADEFAGVLEFFLTGAAAT